LGIEEQAQDSEPFDEKMTRLTGELAKIFAKSNHLEAEIRSQLKRIAYEF
jgi:type I restriction enzyme M protein